jgi:glycosyltransferase involved in cell wall biosynthesis
MSYDCVIATRNRINAVKMSIPLILKQGISPNRLIVIDASDNHDSVRTEVNGISQRLGFENTVVVKSDAANLARQRNIGLQFVQAPVVMFPDDDSMWHPGFASNVLKIYKADVRGQVGGVSGLGVLTPPPELEQPSHAHGFFRKA